MKNDAPTEYQRVVVYKDINAEVVIIEWPPGAETQWHDHGGAKGIVVVLEGRLREMVCEKQQPKNVFRTFFRNHGEVFFEMSDTIHKMKNISPRKAVTAHVYVGKLEMKEYTEEELKKEGGSL